jgi:23S rRNA pseudouridine1911/1915/1917 synthase
MKSLATTLTEPARLDRAVQTLTGLSRSQVRGLLDHACVRVNGEEAPAANAMLAVGDRVEVRYNPHTRYHEKPKPRDDPAYRLLFEDQHIIVVNKAAHVLTVPTPGGKGKTLIDAVQRALDRAPQRGAISSRGKSRQLHVVHRLDLGVSGVLVIAKTPDAAERIRRQFASHKPERVYIAIVSGEMQSKRGTFRSHLATDMMLNRYSTRKAGKGELAITHFEVMRAARGATAVRVRLETGKRNQIRVHFAEAGHPVLGDPRYPLEGSRVGGGGRIERGGRGGPIERGGGGGPIERGGGAGGGGGPRKREATPTTSRHQRWKARRLALHAHTLAFEHPITGEPLRFHADLPREFEPFMRGVGP